MKPGKVSKAIDTSSDFKTVKGLEERESLVLEQVKEKTGFKVEKNIWKSSYWGSKQIGAANYLGTYKGQKAILKIQGARPAMSEIDVLEAFEKQNKSKIIRTAKLYDFIRWSGGDQFEALILEYVDGQKVITSKRPTSMAEIEEFLMVYAEYRLNCRNKPWLDKPNRLPDFNEIFGKLSRVREEIYPSHPLRQKEDDDLIKQALPILQKEISLEKLEFIHGHLSAEDIFRVNERREYVLFSNLFWNWKHPFYDLIFAYHWLIYNLAEFLSTNRQLIENQRELWINQMEEIDWVKNDLRGFKVALLERAVAGLTMDAFAYIDPKNPAALPLVESTRDQVRLLVAELT